MKNYISNKYTLFAINAMFIIKSMFVASRCQVRVRLQRNTAVTVKTNPITLAIHASTLHPNGTSYPSHKQETTPINKHVSPNIKNPTEICMHNSHTNSLTNGFIFLSFQQLLFNFIISILICQLVF